MAELRLASGDPNRRRRMLVTGPHSTEPTSLTDESGTGEGMMDGQAFQTLSRDQMIRRVISPRVWKHTILVSLFLLLPSGLMAIRLSGSPRPERLPGFLQEIQPTDFVRIVQGFAGLELFVAGQLCLLICWVRAASAVDFRGHYRTWRWLAIFLSGSSVWLLTGAAPLAANMVAELVKPLVGPVQAARPALLFVPAGAFAAFILRYLIPDMGRCRLAQRLAILAIILIVARVLLGIRGPFQSDDFFLACLNLLICGLTLSAVQLQCRYVIHVNANPPVRSSRTHKRKDPASASHQAARVDEEVISVATVPGHLQLRSTEAEVPAESKLANASEIADRAEAEIANDSAEENPGKPKSLSKTKSNKKPTRKAG